MYGVQRGLLPDLWPWNDEVVVGGGCQASHCRFMPVESVYQVQVGPGPLQLEARAGHLPHAHDLHNHSSVQHTWYTQYLIAHAVTFHYATIAHLLCTPVRTYMDTEANSQLWNTKGIYSYARCAWAEYIRHIYVRIDQRDNYCTFCTKYWKPCGSIHVQRYFLVTRASPQQSCTSIL